MPCPSGGGILYKGDSIEEVMKQCGKPIATKSNIQIISTFEQWTYYFPYPYNYGDVKLEFFFKNDAVSEIKITEHSVLYFCRSGAIQIGPVTTYQFSCGDWIYNTAYTKLCGQWINLGDNTQLVLAICGNPAEKNSQINKIETTELIYPSQTIIFQNGKLTEWR